MVSSSGSGPASRGLINVIEGILEKRKFTGWDLTDIAFDFFRSNYTITFEYEGKKPMPIVITAELAAKVIQDTGGYFKMKKMMRETLLPNSDTE